MVGTCGCVGVNAERCEGGRKTSVEENLSGKVEFGQKFGQGTTLRGGTNLRENTGTIRNAATSGGFRRNRASNDVAGVGTNNSGLENTGLGVGLHKILVKILKERGGGGNNYILNNWQD